MEQKPTLPAKGIRTFSLLALLAIVVLLFVSPDSYLHDLWRHSDSAWFFMSGKAWMSGLKPYVDFADSKGPLLWLIYGVGYLISPTDYTGVFWISCVAYAVTYFFVYLTAKIFITSRQALLVSVLMSLFFFYPYVHHEVRCEDFNQMLMAIVMWLTCKTLYADEHLSAATFRRTSISIGLCVAASLLIKYNVTPMLAFAMCFILHRSWRQGGGVIVPALWFALGMAVLLLPMMVYLYATGCFDAFVNEYFLHTFTVVGDSHSMMGGVISRFMQHWLSVGAVLLVGLVGSFAMALLLRRYRFFPLAMFVVVSSLTLVHATWTFHYGTCLLFPMFALIVLFRYFSSGGWEHLFEHRAIVVTVMIFAIVATTAVNWYKHGEDLFFRNDVRSADQYRFASMMSSVEHPLVMYYFTGPYPEYGVQLHSLPANVYWASQSGATAQMDSVQREVARQGQADFIFALHGTSACEKLKAMGYNCYESSPVPGEPYRLDLFSKHQLSEPQKPYEYRPLDILLKRNPFK